MDNCVAALLSLARHQSQHCPPNLSPWPLVLSKLPMKDDQEEAKKVHLILAQLLQQQHPALVDASNLGKVLAVLCDIHKQEDISTKEIDTIILAIFKAIPQDMIGQHAAAFNEKQRLKIQKIVTS